ncbi:phage antirepressor [Solibacillus sp. FSL K6-1781]|uniref:phage antirepressor n=1 Tax=Solibacillus sp. FSL K6-1781 TaxID=2921474 RepID=UPI00315AD160
MQQLQNFIFGSYQIRVIQVENEHWFVANDVCKVLEIKNTTQAIQRLEVDERSMFNIGRQGEANIVNEYGLYSLILASRKDEAKKFKRWITHEVIPSIRKQGAYLTPETIEQVLLNPDTIIKIAQNLKDEQERRQIAESKLEQQKPKVLFADSVSASETSILIRDLAKLITQNGIPIGEKRLFTWLRENGYLIKKFGSDYNSPTQRSMEMNLFEIKESTINRSQGIQITKTPKVTGRGQIYFINKFLTKAKAI